MKTINPVSFTTAKSNFSAVSDQDFDSDTYNERVYEYLQNAKPSEYTSELMDKIRSLAGSDTRVLLSDISNAIIYADSQLKLSPNQEDNNYASSTFDNLSCNFTDINAMMNVMMNKMLTSDDAEDEE